MKSRKLFVAIIAILVFVSRLAVLQMFLQPMPITTVSMPTMPVPIIPAFRLTFPSLLHGH